MLEQAIDLMGLVRIPASEASPRPAGWTVWTKPSSFGEEALITARASNWPYGLAVQRRDDCRPSHPLEDASEKARQRWHW